MPPPIPPWLFVLARKYGWQVAAYVFQATGRGQLDKVTARQSAITMARTTRDGRFAGLLVEGRLRYVVFSGDRPVSAFPPAEGDLTELLKDYNGQGLRRPDELTFAQTLRWLKEHLPGGGKAEPGPAEDLAAVAPSNGAARFAEIAARLPELLKQLTSSPKKPFSEHEPLSAGPGIYLFSEGPAPMYVGQTRNLKQRLHQHTSASSRENQASFAFRLAEEAAVDQGLQIDGTRKQRAEDERFNELFRQARERVARMAVRDPLGLAEWEQEGPDAEYSFLYRV